MAKGGHLVLEQHFGAAVEDPTCGSSHPGRRKAKRVVEIAAMPLAEDGEVLGLIPGRLPILKDFEVGFLRAPVDRAPITRPGAVDGGGR